MGKGSRISESEAVLFLPRYTISSAHFPADSTLNVLGQEFLSLFVEDRPGQPNCILALVWWCWWSTAVVSGRVGATRPPPPPAGGCVPIGQSSREELSADFGWALGGGWMGRLPGGRGVVVGRKWAGEWPPPPRVTK